MKASKFSDTQKAFISKQGRPTRGAVDSLKLYLRKSLP